MVQLNGTTPTGRPAQDGRRGITYHVNGRLIDAASTLPDTDKAAELITTAATNANIVANGEEIAALEHELRRVDQQLKPREAEYRKLARARSQAPRIIQGCTADGSDDERPFQVLPHNWSLRDQVTAALYLVGSFALLVTSALAVHASLIDTQTPIFLENPVLPLALSLLPVGISIAVKFIGTLFKSATGRDRFRVGVALLTVFFAGTWMGLFAAKYGGLSGGFELFAEPDKLFDWAYVVSQLGTEVSAGTLLFFGADDLLAKNTRETYVDNPLRTELDVQERALAAEIEPLLSARAAALGRLDVLRAQGQLDAAVSEAALVQLTSHRTFTPLV